MTLTVNTYFRLSTAIRNFMNTKMRNITENGITAPLGLFLTRFKKGSNRIRKVMEKESVANTNITTFRTVLKFYDLVGADLPEKESIENFHSMWGNVHVQNSIREFIFKFLNNQLPLNTRLSHYAEGVERGCSLCYASKLLPAAEETFCHLFFDCTVTGSILARVGHNYFAGFYPNSRPDQIKFWFTFSQNFEGGNGFVTWTKIVVLYKIWRMKIEKTIRPYHRIMGEIEDILFEILANDGWLRQSCRSAPMQYCANLCLRFQHERQQRH